MKTLILASFMLFGCSGISPVAGPVTMAPEAASAWLAETPAAQIVDVRSQEEYATGHLSKAVLLPWVGSDFTTPATKVLDPKKPVFVYCRSGRRSAAAAAALAKLGFADVRNLGGGILAWQKTGKSITKPE